MAWKPLGGKTRRFVNTETGETISRRQYDKITKGVNYEKKAALNKQKDLAKALARPARGRTKAETQREIEFRLAAAEEKAEQERRRRLDKLAASSRKKIRVKKIRPQLLKTGHRAERIPFQTWEQLEDLREQMLRNKLPNGRRLITSYGVGVTGFDERTGQQISATLVTLQSPSVQIDEEEFEEIVLDFLNEKPYFVFSHYWAHLHFDIDYAEGRLKKARQKNIPKQYRKR